MKKKLTEIFKKWVKFEVGDVADMAEARRAGNMNEDRPQEGLQLAAIKEYLMVEAVAVPPDFQIENHLKMREAAGIFENEHVNLKQLALISEGVKSSPIFATLNNPVIEPHTCMYFLHIMEELGLVITSVDNPVKRNRQEYNAFLNGWSDQQRNFVRGQEVYRINFVVINLYQIYQQNIMTEVKDSIEQVLKHTEDVRKMKEGL